MQLHEVLNFFSFMIQIPRILNFFLSEILLKLTILRGDILDQIQFEEKLKFSSMKYEIYIFCHFTCKFVKNFKNLKNIKSNFV